MSTVTIIYPRAYEKCRISGPTSDLYELYACLVALLCPIICDPRHCSLPGSSVHGISQARILEWLTISFSGEPRGLNPHFLCLLHWTLLPVISVNIRYCGHWAVYLCSHPQKCSPRGFRIEKSRIRALDTQGAYQKNDLFH